MSERFDRDNHDRLFLAAKVRAVNNAGDYVNKLYAVLLPIFTAAVGDKIVKAGGQFTAKFAAKLPELPKLPSLHVRHEWNSSTSVTFVVKTCEHCPAPSGTYDLAQYHETWVRVGNLRNHVLTEVYPAPDPWRTGWTVDEVIAARKKCAEARDAYHNARTACYPFGEG